MYLMKTVQLDLLEPTERKKEIIEEGMKQTTEVMNQTAKRMPSFSKYLIKKQKARVFYNCVKDWRNNGITLSAQCTQKAVEKVRESYVQMETTKKERLENYYRKLKKFQKGDIQKRSHKPRKIPVYKKANLVVLHNQAFEIEEHEGRWYINCTIFPRKKILLPFKTGEFQKEFLKGIKKKCFSYGASEIVKYGNKYKFNLVVRKIASKTKKKRIKHIASIDLGLKNIATLVIANKKGKIKEVKLFSGGEAAFLRLKCYYRRKDLSRDKKLKEIKKTKGYEKRWIDNMNHNISRKIIDIVRKYSGSIIVFEDLKNIRKTARERSGLKGRAKRKRNRMLSSWDFARLKSYIIYKAQGYRIPVMEVAAAFTSQRCNKCGHQDKENRNGIQFHCLKCGYESNADFNAAVNIGKRAAGKLYAS